MLRNFQGKADGWFVNWYDASLGVHLVLSQVRLLWSDISYTPLVTCYGITRCLHIVTVQSRESALGTKLNSWNNRCRVGPSWTPAGAQWFDSSRMRLWANDNFVVGLLGESRGALGSGPNTNCKTVMLSCLEWLGMGRSRAGGASRQRARRTVLRGSVSMCEVRAHYWWPEGAGSRRGLGQSPNKNFCFFTGCSTQPAYFVLIWACSCNRESLRQTL